MSATEIVAGCIRTVDEIMPVMTSAFDAAFGEAWTAPQCAGILSLPGSHLVIARVSGRVAAFALTRVIFDEAELLLIAVDPLYQRQRIGASLLDRTLEDTAKMGVKKIFLEVRANNPALHFYQQRQFCVAGTRRNYYRGAHGQLNDAVTLSRIIG